MVVRVVSVTPPAAGADWSFTVPAQWLPYLYGVTAVLRSAGAFTTLADETGNGHTLTLVAGNTYTFPTQGPYVGGADNGAVFHAATPTAPNNMFGFTAADILFGPAAFTVDGWWNASIPANIGLNGDFWGLFGVPGGQVGSINAALNTNDPLDLQIASAGSATTVKVGFMSRATWHHVASTWDGANWRFYVDGVLNTTTALKPFLGAGNTNRFEVPGNQSAGIWFGSCAGVAFYPAALAVGNIAAHAAATASAAAYKTAVLLDTPTAYYGLNALPKGASRIATLKITDGTRTVAQFPADFTALTADSFTWSWQVLGPGAQASTDGRVNSVPIPELPVDAGYVISAVTLDKTGTDQWGPITLWFDDGTGGGGGGTSGRRVAPYTNALLVPDYTRMR